MDEPSIKLKDLYNAMDEPSIKLKDLYNGMDEPSLIHYRHHINGIKFRIEKNVKHSNNLIFSFTEWVGVCWACFSRRGSLILSTISLISGSLL